MERRPFVTGEINYFGYGDPPLPKAQCAIPWHSGDTFTFATFFRKPIDDATPSTPSGLYPCYLPLILPSAEDQC
jgi:hypothetical protein